MSTTYQTFSIDPRHRAPLVDFMIDALAASGCSILHRSSADEAPFRISFLTPYGERMGIVAYAFYANSRSTRNRPADEHRFQIKYGSKDGRLHHLWQDPYGLYTTICIGINPQQGFFVGIDPVLNSPTLFFISKEFKQHHADEILAKGWHAWERYVRPRRAEAVNSEPELDLFSTSRHVEPFSDGHEVLVGARPEHFLRYVLFEREVIGEDQGHRQLIAERFSDGVGTIEQGTRDDIIVPARRLHTLEQEFELDSAEILELIANAPRLKMAVRGWVAEQHLRQELERISIVEDVRTLEEDGRPDFEIHVRGGRAPILIECKNVLRSTDSQGRARLDFMRTRASLGDPCSRYYGPGDFDLLAACLHARTERWEFRSRRTRDMVPHNHCSGKLHHRIVVDDSWDTDLEGTLRAAARAA
jgi:hypothetical protein